MLTYLIDTLILFLGYIVGTPLFGFLKPLMTVGAVATLLVSAVLVALFVRQPRNKRCITVELSEVERSAYCLSLNGLMLRILTKTFIMNALLLLIVYTGSLAVLIASELLYHFIVRKINLSEVVGLEVLCCIDGELYAETCDIRGKVTKVYRRAVVAVTPLSKVIYVIPSSRQRDVEQFIEACRKNGRKKGK